MYGSMTSFLSPPRRFAGTAIVVLVLLGGCGRSGSHSKAEAPNASSAGGSQDVTQSKAEPLDTPLADSSRAAPVSPAPEQVAPHKTASVRPEPAPPLVLPAGSHIVAALQSDLSSSTAKVGDEVTLRTLEPVTIDGRTTVPAGATIKGEVTYAKSAGRIKGAPELTLRFSELAMPDGHRYPITCEPFRAVGKSAGGESAREIGGGAAAGAVVGALLGKGSGALKGAVVGGVLGTGVAVTTKGTELELPAGQQISVDLTAPLTLSAGK